MANLTLGIQHLAVAIPQTLYATFTTAPLVGFLDPFTLLAPVIIEPRLPILGYSHQTLPLTQYIYPPHGIERQEVEALLDSEAGGLEFCFNRFCR